MGTETQQLVHVLLVSFPSQGHINPLLRLGKRLATEGLLVTFATTENYGSAMRKSSDTITDKLTPVGDGFLRFEFMDDEYEKGDDPRRNDLDEYLLQLDRTGRKYLPAMLSRLAAEGMPVSCLINNPFIPWVSDVADQQGVPSAMLWVQSCACFLSYYYYYHHLVDFPDEENPFRDIHIPTLPVLRWDEIPSFMHPMTPYPYLRRAIMGQYKYISKPFCILMDTFEELESEIIKFTSTLCPVKSIGPLFKNPRSVSLSVDMLKADGNCLPWLDTKPAASVVYISFGTVVFLQQEQINEIAHGILDAGVSFLWVLRPPGLYFGGGQIPHTLPEGFLEKVGDKGKVVVYSPQEQVLKHPAVACFVTHCGWNSTMESLTLGVPVVAFPQWGDQVTDAKFLVDVFKTGVRMCRGEQEERIIPREEVVSCLREATVGAKMEEIKKNAMAWKKKAEAAVADGGSSVRNLETFIDEVKSRRVEMVAAAGDKKWIEKPTAVGSHVAGIAS
ncbi:hypothetical protein Drorol1_Dr00005797 [Drosera rotundifolia]